MYRAADKSFVLAAPREDGRLQPVQIQLADGRWAYLVSQPPPPGPPRPRPPLAGAPYYWQG